jgi:group II intron reverse transcriptase/maturase
MYVASELDKSWLQNEQRRLYERSRNNPDYVFCKLWGLVTDPRNLRMAVARVARNKGARTAGVDGLNVRRALAAGVDTFVQHLRTELRTGGYRPSAVRRVLIPKPGQPGKFRPLGIPTVRDRVVQAAVKNILEPVFEADFYPVSHGFRPGKRAHGALEQLRLLMRPKDRGKQSERRLPYQWAIEGDIKGCFDNIDHHGLMNRVRRRIADAKVNRLVVAFLKAGVLAEEQFLRTDSGTPQGGILSPLLANVALSVIEERYERHVWPRRTPTLRTQDERIAERARRARGTDRNRGLPILFPVRYADDFIILVSVPPGPEQSQRAEQAAHQEKAAVAALLKEELHLELSESKTLVTPVTQPMRFLGHHVRVRPHPSHRRLVIATLIPKQRTQRLRERIKQQFGPQRQNLSLGENLRMLNPALRGFCSFYRHAWGAKRVFAALDHYLWWTIFRWVKKKHGRSWRTTAAARYVWRKPGGRQLRWKDGDVLPFEMSRTRVRPFSMGELKPPHFASPSTESPVHNERCTPGSERGTRKPARGQPG